jgi:hypothetical protein
MKPITEKQSTDINQKSTRLTLKMLSVQNKQKQIIK